VLGQLIDLDPAPQPHYEALGDDVDALFFEPGAQVVSEDEDGVHFTSHLYTGREAAMSVQVGQAAGVLDAWVDFNQDGDWEDEGEQIFVGEPLGIGTHNLSFNVPESSKPGETFARFRLSSTGGLAPSGDAPDGEIEDYRLVIESGVILLDNGTVAITGSDGADEVEIEQIDANTLSVVANIGGVEFRRQFESASVTLITFVGGDGDDVFSNATDIPSHADGGGGNDRLSGGFGTDLLQGGPGDDWLFGNWGRDTIHGGDGHDEIDGGQDPDYLYGDAGNDNMYGGVGGDGDELHGGDGDDVIDGGAGNDWMLGDAGNDTIHGRNGQDYLDGGAGNDSLFGDAGPDTIHGREGDDHVDGGEDADQLFGGAGNDNIYGGSGEAPDTIDGGMDDDLIDGGGGDDWLFGDWGRDTIYGGDGHDDMDGGQDPDFLYGDAGNDNMYGGVGGDGDELHGGDGDDVIDGGAGNDWMLGNEGHDTIHGRNGQDYLDGGPGDDALFGDAGPDTIHGREGDDYIDGGEGADQLYGGTGNNTIQGGGDGDELASEWQNSVQAEDVDKDGIVAPLDAAIIINALNDEGAHLLPRSDNPGHLYDTNGDFYLSNIDVLIVINHLNGQKTGEGEGSRLRNAVAVSAPADASAADRPLALAAVDAALTDEGVSLNRPNLVNAWPPSPATTPISDPAVMAAALADTEDSISDQDDMTNRRRHEAIFELVDEFWLL